MHIERLLDELATSVSGAKALAHVARIAQHHRIQGSPGLQDAAVEVCAALDLFGVAHTVHQTPADGTTQCFKWTAPPAWEIRDGSLEQLTPSQRPLVRFDEVPQSVIAHSPGGEVEAELVHVDEGVEDRHYADRDVTGKFVLAHGRARLVGRAAAARGAAAVVLYPDAKRAAIGYDLVQYQGYYARVPEQARLVPGFCVSRRTADALLAAMTSAPVRLRGSVDASLSKGTQPVVEAFVGQEGESEILLCAHLCHPRASANDNASGSGVLLELARVLSRFHRQHELSHGIRLLWVPEFGGTLPWAAAHAEALRRTWYTVNLDMVGQSPERIGQPLYLFRTPDSTPSPLNAWLEPLTERVMARDDLRAPGGSDRPFLARVQPPGGGSDHIVFNAPPYRVPSVMLGHEDPFWHTNLDTIDKVDASRLQQVGVLAGTLALLPVVLPHDEALLWDWLIAYGGGQLVRASALGRAYPTSRTQLLALAYQCERRRAARLLDHLHRPADDPAGSAYDIAVDAVARALGASQTPKSGGHGPRRITEGPIAYALLDDLPEVDRKLVWEKFARLFFVLLEETANLCDGMRSPEEIALRLSLDTGRWVPVEDVHEALRILNTLGYVTTS